MKIAVNLSPEQTEHIIAHELLTHISHFKRDMHFIKKENRGHFFSIDPVEDIDQLEKHIAAMELVVSYFTTPEALDKIKQDVYL